MLYRTKFTGSEQGFSSSRFVCHVHSHTDTHTHLQCMMHPPQMRCVALHRVPSQEKPPRADTHSLFCSTRQFKCVHCNCTRRCQPLAQPVRNVCPTSCAGSLQLSALDWESAFCTACEVAVGCFFFPQLISRKRSRGITLNKRETQNTHTHAPTSRHRPGQTSHRVVRLRLRKEHTNADNWQRVWRTDAGVFTHFCW